MWRQIQADGSTGLTLTHAGQWTLTMPDGSSIDLGENFQEGDFGIHLEDAPTNLTTTTTISGDLTPIDFDPTQDGVQMHLDALGNVITSAAPMAGRSDFLYDTTGNDRIECNDGNDIVYAGSGDDWILGGNGRDGLGVRNDQVSNNDIVEGGAGADVIYGGDGDDRLFGDNYGELATYINAGEIAQSIDEQGDIVGGASGNDFVYGTDRNDALFGGTGQDTIVAGGGNDFISSGGNFDGTMSYKRLVDGAYTYENGPLFDWTYTTQFDGSVYTPVFTNLTSFTLGSTDTAGDVVYAGSGNDMVLGAGGADEIYGGDGDDIVYGQGGDNTIFGGEGNDFLSGVGNGNDGNNYIDGGAGNDKLYGGSKDDQLFGGDGIDELQGGDGDDYLDGETGDDLLFGGIGNDQLMGGLVLFADNYATASERRLAA